MIYNIHGIDDGWVKKEKFTEVAKSSPPPVLFKRCPKTNKVIPMNKNAYGEMIFYKWKMLYYEKAIFDIDFKKIHDENGKDLLEGKIRYLLFLCEDVSSVREKVSFSHNHSVDTCRAGRSWALNHLGFLVYLRPVFDLVVKKFQIMTLLKKWFESEFSFKTKNKSFEDPRLLTQLLCVVKGLTHFGGELFVSAKYLMRVLFSFSVKNVALVKDDSSLGDWIENIVNSWEALTRILATTSPYGHMGIKEYVRSYRTYLGKDFDIESFFDNVVPFLVLKLPVRSTPSKVYGRRVQIGQHLFYMVIAHSMTLDFRYLNSYFRHACREKLVRRSILNVVYIFEEHVCGKKLCDHFVLLLVFYILRFLGYVCSEHGNSSLVTSSRVHLDQEREDKVFDVGNSAMVKLLRTLLRVLLDEKYEKILRQIEDLRHQCFDVISDLCLFCERNEGPKVLFLAKTLHRPLEIWIRQIVSGKMRDMEIINKILRMIGGLYGKGNLTIRTWRYGKCVSSENENEKEMMKVHRNYLLRQNGFADLCIKLFCYLYRNLVNWRKQCYSAIETPILISIFRHSTVLMQPNFLNKEKNEEYLCKLLLYREPLPSELNREKNEDYLCKLLLCGEQPLPSDLRKIDMKCIENSIFREFLLVYYTTPPRVRTNLMNVLSNRLMLFQSTSTVMLNFFRLNFDHPVFNLRNLLKTLREDAASAQLKYYQGCFLGAAYKLNLHFLKIYQLQHARKEYLKQKFGEEMDENDEEVKAVSKKMKEAMYQRIEEEMKEELQKLDSDNYETKMKERLKHENPMKRCGNCFKFGNHKKCSRCLAVYYCSTRCQKENWKIHKKMCVRHKKFHGKEKR